MSKPILEDPVDAARKAFFVYAQQKAAKYYKEQLGYAALLSELVMESIYNRRFLTDGVLKCLRDIMEGKCHEQLDKVPVHNGLPENSSLAVAV